MRLLSLFLIGLIGHALSTNLARYDHEQNQRSLYSLTTAEEWASNMNYAEHPWYIRVWHHFLRFFGFKPAEEGKNAPESALKKSSEKGKNAPESALKKSSEKAPSKSFESTKEEIEPSKIDLEREALNEAEAEWKKLKEAFQPGDSLEELQAAADAFAGTVNGATHLNKHKNEEYQDYMDKHTEMEQFLEDEGRAQSVEALKYVKKELAAYQKISFGMPMKVIKELLDKLDTIDEVFLFDDNEKSELQATIKTVKEAQAKKAFEGVSGTLKNMRDMKIALNDEDFIKLDSDIKSINKDHLPEEYKLGLLAAIDEVKAAQGCNYIAKNKEKFERAETKHTRALANYIKDAFLDAKQTKFCDWWTPVKGKSYLGKADDENAACWCCEEKPKPNCLDTSGPDNIFKID